METKKLQKIAEKYRELSSNENNFSIGGGLDDIKFASKRHEDACNDEGKLSLGKTCQLFKKATDCELEAIKAIIEDAFSGLEWHHAGKLPKRYGGGMKKTYFLNAKEVCFIAENFETLLTKYLKSKEQERTEKIQASEKREKKLIFLEANAKRIERVAEKPANFYTDYSEMNGKYGWFIADLKYSMTVYYTGWRFEDEVKFKEFIENYL